MKKFYLKSLLFLLVSFLFINCSALAQMAHSEAKNDPSVNKAHFKQFLADRMLQAHINLQKEEAIKKPQASAYHSKGDKNTLNDPMQLVYSISTAGAAIELPLYGTVNCTVDWGDGSPTENFTTAGLKPHTFASSGTYTVEISGTLTQFGRYEFFVYYVGIEYLTQVLSFGDLGLTSLDFAFHNADNLLSVPAILPATITSMRYTFYKNDRPSFQNLNNWDMSHVTTLRGAFSSASNFNQDISGWNIGSATNISELFATDDGTTIFNQPIGNWDVSHVTNMDYIFVNNVAFNQPIENWDVSNVTGSEFLFAFASSFNQSIENWNLQSATSLPGLFGYATQYNQPINNLDVSHVNHSFSAMFYGASSFNQPLDNWDVSHVRFMEEMFRDATSFNQDLSNWDIGSLESANKILENSSLSTPNYNELLNSWASQSVHSAVRFGTGTIKYSTSASAAHATLTGAPNNWIITDGGMILNDIAWANLSSPENIIINQGEGLMVQGNVYVDGITDPAGPAANIQAWVGWSITDSDPSTWTNWIPANYLSDNGSYDLYQANIGASVFEQLGQTDCYVAMRYQYQGNNMVYGGYNGGFWNGTSNVNGHVQILPNTIPLSNWSFALIGLFALGFVYIRLRR